jgi:hypothetical protein
VASRLGESCKTVLQLSAKILYEFASSCDAIVEQVEIGQLLPTLEAIKAAKEAERQAREAEQLARPEIKTREAETSSLSPEITAG